MLRAAAKNHDARHGRRRPADYGTVLAEMRRERRQRVSRDAPAARRQGLRAHGRYDATIAAYLDRRSRGDRPASSPTCSTLQFRKRLGPALRRESAPAGGVLRRRRTRRAQRSAGARSCRARSCRSTTSPTPTPRSSACGSSTTPACVIVKHANPCGVAVARNARCEAYDKRVPHRPDLGLRRHHRVQPPARRRDREGDRRAPVRRGASSRRAVDAERPRGSAPEEERARAGDRRPRAERPGASSSAA